MTACLLGVISEVMSALGTIASLQPAGAWSA